MNYIQAEHLEDESDNKEFILDPLVDTQTFPDQHHKLPFDSHQVHHIGINWEEEFHPFKRKVTNNLCPICGFHHSNEEACTPSGPKSPANIHVTATDISQNPIQWTSTSSKQDTSLQILQNT